MREWRKILCVGLLLSLGAGACWRGAKVVKYIRASEFPIRIRSDMTARLQYVVAEPTPIKLSFKYHYLNKILPKK